MPPVSRKSMRIRFIVSCFICHSPFSLNRVQSGTCPSYAEARKGARKCTETLPRGKERLIVFDRLADDRRQQGVGYRRRTDTEELRREPPLAQNLPNDRIVEHRVGRRTYCLSQKSHYQFILFSIPSGYIISL